jgi:hypothetical protein
MVKTVFPKAKIEAESAGNFFMGLRLRHIVKVTLNGKGPILTADCHNYKPIFKIKCHYYSIETQQQ